MKYFFIISFLLMVAAGAMAQPKIGLTLSGGGAKGLAHIGVLKAIDSAGLKIDYLTGTSMGSIIGGLYAAGYSGDSIESLARDIDWSTVLSNNISMRNYIMEEKSEYQKYAVELPIVKGKPKLPVGILESQELWLKLEDIFFPVHTITDFDKLSIPFRCIATDLATGEATVISHGSLYKAIRASMAIPGVFSSVSMNGTSYVDGGVVRNFPVKDVKAMGATYTIGVSVSAPLKEISDLDNAAKILSQVIFLGESVDRNEEVPLCNKFYEVPMGEFGAGDFDQAAEIIELGMAYGRTLYPQFKQLADSLAAINGNKGFVKNRIPDVQDYRIDAIDIDGLAPKEKSFFREQIQLGDSLRRFTSRQLAEATRNAFAFRTYSAITYDIQQNSSGTNTLSFHVKKEPKFTIKGGINYNTFNGFLLQGNVTARNWLTPYSRTMLTIGAGDNLRGLLEHLQLLNQKATWSYRGSIYAEHQELNDYEGNKSKALYRFRYYTFDNQFLNSRRRKWSAGLGVRLDMVIAKPKTFSGLYVEGKNTFLNLYAAANYNSFERPQYPRKGLKMDYQFAYVAAASPKFKVFENGNLIGDQDNFPIAAANYFQSRFNAHHVLPLSAHWALETKLQSSFNLKSKAVLLNEFYIGGVTKTYRNQITFVGAREAQFSSQSTAVGSAAFRFNPTGELYLTATYNALLYDFIGSGLSSQFVHGAGITAAYNMVLGPLEFTAMWNSETKTVGGYINLGFPFR